MSLADQYKARFASSLRSRGEDILLSRGVFSATRSEHTIRGEVRSSSQTGKYNVEVRLSRLRPAIEKFSCTCPYFDDAGVCKHLWAFLRTIDILQLQDGSANPKSKEADIAINKPRSSERTQVPEWKSVLSNLNDEFSRQSHNNRTFSSISDARPQQFWYIINLDSLQNSSDTIIIRVMTQLIKTNGQAGSLKEFRLESREIGSVRDEVHNRVLKDLEELSQLERISQYSSIRSHYYQRLPATSEVKLSPSRHTTILQRIAATGRLCCVFLNRSRSTMLSLSPPARHLLGTKD